MNSLLAAIPLLTPLIGGSTVISQPYAWDNVTIVGGGFVSGIHFHPKQKDLIYARTDIGGAYRWDPKNKRWIPLLDWLQRPDWNLYGIESVGLDPNDPKRLYLACGTYTNDWAGNGAILRSNDQGRSFKRTDLPYKLGGNMDGRSMGERLAVDPHAGNVLYFGSRSAGLWKSVDAAATWTKVESFPVSGPTNGIGVGFVVFDPHSGKKQGPTPTIYVGVASTVTGLYRSNDAGATWEAVPGQPVGLYPHHAAIDAAGKMYLTFANGPGPNGLTKGEVCSFDTKTGIWTDITPEKPTADRAFGYAGLSLDERHQGTVVVTTLDRWNPGDDVFRTLDGGAHWSSMRTDAKMDCSASPFLKWGQPAPKFGWWMGTVQIDPFDANRIMFGTGATIWGTDDATNVDRQTPTHWTVRAQGLEETAAIDLISPPKGAHLISGLGDVGGFRHDDFKVAPAQGMLANPLFGNTDGLDFAELNPDVMVRVGRAGANIKRGGYSLDGGVVWSPFGSEPNRSRGGGHVAVSADGGVFVWTPSGSRPSYSIDRGQTWTECIGCPTNLHVIADRVNAKRFYGFDGSMGSFYESTDSCSSFHKTAAQAGQGNATVRAIPGVEGDIWLSCEKKLSHSTDGGVSFSTVSNLTDVSTFGFGKAAPGSPYPALFLIGAISDVEGAFRSDDYGKNWIRITDDKHGFATMDQIIGDPRIFGRVYIGMNGRGVLYGDPRAR